MMALGALMAIAIASLRFSSSTALSGAPPSSVLWIRAMLLPPAMRGGVVEPSGVILILGVDREPGSGESGDFGFLDEHFGENASQEFRKQAIFFNRESAPAVLQRFVPYQTSFLFSAWHCSGETGGWCSRWSAFASRFQEATTCFEWQAGSGTASVCERDTGAPGFELVELNRTLQGSGSHRELHTQVSLKRPESSKSSCELVLVEFLPNTLFADAFQLHRLTTRGKYKLAKLYGDTDLERPADFSRQAIVELHSHLSGEQDPSFLKAEVSLPLHVRYVPLSLTSHYLVNLSTPLLLVRCSDATESAVARGESSELGGSPLLQWGVPAGNPGHHVVVASVTALASLAGAGILSLVSCRRRCTPQSSEG